VARVSQEFDKRVISLGAGAQSTAMYLMACAGLLTPRPDAAVFADTQDERAETMRWLSRLEEVGNIPIIRATRGRLADEVFRSMRETASGFCPIPTYVYEKGRRESQGRRQCTRSHKLAVINQACRELLGLERGERSKPGRIEVWVGISVDEAHRAKPSRYPLLVNRFPLLYDTPMRRGECLAYTEKVMGDRPGKSSCYYCPYRSDADWIAMKETDRESFDRAVEFERQMRAIDPTQFLHDTCKPLGEVNFEPNRTVDMFGEECSGICGV